MELSRTKSHIDERFDLRHVIAAKVSEISEATAASPVPENERVNFHIGNPVQDERLTNLYLKNVLGINPGSGNLSAVDLDNLSEEFGLSDDGKEKLNLLHETIIKNSPYTPRGGYSKSKPPRLIKHFQQWLTQDQKEPLNYDLGEKSGRRECILASGGLNEAMRVLLHSLNDYLIHPANIFLFNIELPPHFTNHSRLTFRNLSVDEEEVFGALSKQIEYEKDKPNFIILGRIPSEELRRNLRNLSLKFPVFFIEVNNADNHLSLAREAKMLNRVIRFLTPGIFLPELRELSTVFIIGNDTFLKVLENVHFKLKGTPSSSEIELLTFLIEHNKSILDISNENEKGNDNFRHSLEPDVFKFYSINRVFKRLNNIVSSKTDLALEAAGGLTSAAQRPLSLLARFKNRMSENNDLFLNKNAFELIDEVLTNIENSDFQSALTESYRNVFAKEHPEYKPGELSVVSGSSRTALSLIGYYCSIENVITYDLSWTYEHCFPKVDVIPLREDFEIDTAAILEAAGKDCQKDKKQKEKTAIIINNPHNASGKIFNRENLKVLIKSLLEKNILVIDDLAYQNVLPVENLDGPLTVKQLALELVKEGCLYSDQLSSIITVHALSKTDGFAGARLAVVDIPDKKIRERFQHVNKFIKPNIFAILIAYLFYRNRSDKIRQYWLLRNKIFQEKMSSLEQALAELPAERNPFDITFRRPEGSMYPQMTINRLPSGLSLDWLSSGLASQGIGLIPLSTFSRTSKGFELARKSFRLTLGGSDSPHDLLRKTRRVLIDLNRLIAEEHSKYNRIELRISPLNFYKHSFYDSFKKEWANVENKLLSEAENAIKDFVNKFSRSVNSTKLTSRFVKEYLPARVAVYNKLFEDQLNLINDLITKHEADNFISLAKTLDTEFFKDNLETKINLFRQRSFDRTVHPTQMYSLYVDLRFNRIVSKIFKGQSISASETDEFRKSFAEEYLGKNVAVNSLEEADELVCDIHSLILSEVYSSTYSEEKLNAILSFWGDWDGSSRPSGQGHRLIAGALLENVNQLSSLLLLLFSKDKTIEIDSELLREIEQLSSTNKKFWKLLNQITALTNQLEKRYRSILPFNVASSRWRKAAVKLGFLDDPLTKLWRHNDSLERKMIDLRQQRRSKLEYYFSLNKKIRKTLHSLIPEIIKNANDPVIAIHFALYRDILKRFILTPRIHQKLITARDQFSINTTVHNLMEINQISGRYGNPGMVLALQVSMSTEPEALISLDKMLNAEYERISKKNDGTELAKVWTIPLLEDLNTVAGFEKYLDKLWDYSVQSRKVDQTPHERFSEMICEVFIAGSDLSQQVGQTAAWSLYKSAKYLTMHWLAKKNLAAKVRIKLGSGEPMQRQGGYYAEYSGCKGFVDSDEKTIRFKRYLKDSTVKSTEFAKSPLLGIFSGGDLRTFQSTISEKLRHLDLERRTQLLYHVYKSQRIYSKELLRVSEPFVETRLLYEPRSAKELQRLTRGRIDDVYKTFTEFTKQNFQNIIYGTDEDVVGIHVISYFISRTSPTLRDRPTVRPSRNLGGDKGQRVLERIASTIPLSKRGSLLRAIGHNKAQSAILGVNQLTTGLFRSFKQFVQNEFSQGEAPVLLSERVLPNLPVYEILHTLRIFTDRELHYINKMSDAFPAGNSAFSSLREDFDSMEEFIPLLQKELLRRHGINVSEFFEGNKFIVDLLPTLRSDLAVLMQPNLFNSAPDKILPGISGRIDDSWLKDFSFRLIIPEKIKYWRSQIWKLFEKPVLAQVKSFVELAVALSSISKDTSLPEIQFSGKPFIGAKLETNLSGLLRGKVDDSMRQFLSAAVQYLTQLPQDAVEIPIDIVRALNQVERILRIEKQALDAKDQELLNFYMLQIARHVGENG